MSEIPKYIDEAAEKLYPALSREELIKNSAVSPSENYHQIDLQEAFIAGAMSPEAAKFHDQMRWVKASEELPERKGEYFVIRDDYKSVAIFDGERFYGNDNWIDVKLWLYEPPV